IASSYVQCPARDAECFGLKPVVCAVAEWPVLALLALAEPDLLGLLLLEDERAMFGRLVRAVAERLLLRQAAGAPRIGLARFEREPGRLLLRDLWRCHFFSVAWSPAGEGAELRRRLTGEQATFPASGKVLRRCNYSHQNCRCWCEQQ